MAYIDMYYGHSVMLTMCFFVSCISAHRYMCFLADIIKRKDEFNTLFDINIWYLGVMGKIILTLLNDSNVKRYRRLWKWLTEKNDLFPLICLGDFYSLLSHSWSYAQSYVNMYVSVSSHPTLFLPLCSSLLLINN